MTTAESVMVLDDFSSDTISRQAFTDRVMGGRSDLEAYLAPGADGTRRLIMRGMVSLENNGGFIQVRIPLFQDGASFDATEYRGIQMEIRSEFTGPEAPEYAVHIRTGTHGRAASAASDQPRHTRFPWAYYVHTIDVTSDWKSIYIPFDEFEAVSTLRRRLDTGSIKSIAVVAGKRPGAAELEVQLIGLVR